MQIGAAIMKNSMAFTQKTKNRVAIWSSNLTTRHINRQKPISSKDAFTPMFIAALFRNNQDMETILISIDRWMDKEDIVCIYNAVLLSLLKKWNSAICSNMDGPRDYHTKWSKSDREKQIPYNIT